MVRTLLVFAFLAATLLPQTDAQAHCQVPCGIYDDHARIHAMLEDVATITKAIEQIQTLSAKKDAQSLNQVTRWIATKESHASRIIGTISTYFLTQKIKPVSPKKTKAYARYIQMLVDHHNVMSLAMKTKQNVKPALVAQLRSAVTHLETYWPGKKR
jgi:nickel superoxide dismutase